LFYVQLVGGVSQDLSTRCIDPEVLKHGYEIVMTKHAAEAAAFGAFQALVVNPFGTVDGEMEFDQWLRRFPDQFDRAEALRDFCPGVDAYRNYLGRAPMIYLGSVRTNPALGINSRWRFRDLATLKYLVAHCLEPFESDCPIVMDGAGFDLNNDGPSESGLSWDVADIIEETRTGGVGCEPWPHQESPFAWIRSRFGVTDIRYLRRLLDVNGSEWAAAGSKIEQSLDCVQRQWVIASDSPETPIEEIVYLLRMGVNVGVVSRGGLYHGKSAAEIEWEASR